MGIQEASCMADAQKNLTLPETCVPWPLASSGFQMIV